MNVFDSAIQNGRITNEIDLKRVFWKLAKKLHPDINSINANHEAFLKLKRDYDEAEEKLKEIWRLKRKGPIPSRESCIQLFIDLIASNFPVDKSIRTNKPYRTRIEKLNDYLCAIDSHYKDLFKNVETELYELRGDSVVLNHEYSVIKLYFYSFSDFTYLRYKTSENHVKNGYSMIKAILEKYQMNSTEIFIDWLIQDVDVTMK